MAEETPLVAGPEPTEIVTFKDENTGLTVLRAKVSLPLPGFWMPSTREGVAEPGLSEIYLAASQAAFVMPEDDDDTTDDESAPETPAE